MHRAYAPDVDDPQLPVLLTQSPTSSATGPDEVSAALSARLAARAASAWGRFNLTAESFFAFVEATGPVYAGKLLRDALGNSHAHGPDAQTLRLSRELALKERVDTAEILHADEAFGVLELILTAPVVVASWISLQCYGSVTPPHVFGAGNKLLHNVTGGVGVVEGNGGALRAGLPWQSVHDRRTLAHDPLRLTVCIEAPQEAITDILRRHDGAPALFDNRWLHLIAMDEERRPSARYTKGLSRQSA